MPAALPRWLALGFLAVAIASIPVLAVRVPALSDYPSHLSRAFVLAQYDRSPSFQHFFSIHLAVIPNLAFDLVVVPLVRAGLDIEAAGRVFIIAAIALLVTGTMALHAALHRRLSAWPALAGGFVYGDTTLYGFLNYLFGVGLALCAAAAWVTLRPRQPGRAAVLLALFSVALFFSHFLVLLLCLGLVASHEVARWGLTRDVESTYLGRSLLLLAPAAIVPGLLFLCSPTSGAPSDVSWASLLAQLQPGAIYWRLRQIANFSWAYAPVLDGVCVLLVAAALALAALRGSARMAPAMALPIAGLVLVYAVTPDGWIGTWRLPERLSIVIFLLSLAATDLSLAGKRERAALALFIGALVLVRTGMVLEAWRAANRDYAPLIAGFEQMPVGATIDSVVIRHAGFEASQDQLRPPFMHLPGYATLRRDAFFSGTFIDPAQNILTLAPGLGPEDHAHLRDYIIDRRDGTGNLALFAPQRLATFDYMLVVHPDLMPSLLPERLRLVARTAEAGLYRVEK